jgi:hypothetical protein
MPKKEKEKRKKHHKHHKHNKHRSGGVEKEKHHKSRKEKSRRRESSSSESDSSSSVKGSSRRSVVTGRKLKLQRHEDEESRQAEMRREAIREAMNGGEKLGESTADDAPKSSFERAVAEKLKDKEGLHKMMLAKAEHAKFQLATGIGIDKPGPKKGGFFPDRGRTV